MSSSQTINHNTTACVTFLIIASDFFIYIGDLKNIFKKIRNVSKENTLFIFSTEKLNQGNYMLLKSGRYAHSESYIHQLLKQCSFNILEKKDVTIRKHKSGSVIGEIYLTEYIP